MTAADTIVERPVEVKLCPACGSRFGIEAAFCPFDGVALGTTTWNRTQDHLTGKRVDGRYEVLEPLGEGGMGTVYRVRHVTLDRPFAMKVLRRDLADDAELAQRFMQEARATAVIKHPGVVAITDFGELEDKTPYFVMELLVGETLATRIRARGPLAAADAIRVGRKIALALEASHAAGVIHRDLKPDNVFLVGKAAGRAAEDEIRVVDFGAAKVVGASKLTRPGIVFGTPYYMSPEQASGGTVDARADVYSLGVLLYEMLTGRVPFEADTYMGVLTKHMFASPGRPSERMSPGAELGALEDVILCALEKDPSQRYPDMAAFAAALHGAQRPSALQRAGRSDRPRPPLPQVSQADRIQAMLERRHAEERRRRSSVVAIASLAALAAVLLAVTALSVARDRRGPGAASAEVAPPRGASAALAASLGAGALLDPPTPTPALPAPSWAPSAAPPPPGSVSAETEAGGASGPSARRYPSGVRAPAAGRPASTTAPATTPPSAPEPARPRPARVADEFPDPWKR